MGKLSSFASIAVSDSREAARAVKRKVVWTLENSGHAHRIPMRQKARSKVFAAAYETGVWGSTESGSGTGSELRATEVLRAELGALLRRHGVTSLLDAPCGDWNWMQHIDLSGIAYTGADIVDPVIAANREKHTRPGVEFRVADLTRDELPSVDAVLCRDCLVHVSYRDIAAILANFRSTGATWLLLNTYPEVTGNRDQFTGPGWRRLNFERAPFNFPAPLEQLRDGGDVDPSRLSLWRIADLPELVL